MPLIVPAMSRRSADTLLEHTKDDYHALDTKALALCGVALIDDIDRIAEASTMFRAARAITQDKGTVRRVLRLFDALALADRSGILGPGPRRGRRSRSLTAALASFSVRAKTCHLQVALHKKHYRA
jgi:hypothetical protein